MTLIINVICLEPIVEETALTLPLISSNFHSGFCSEEGRLSHMAADLGHNDLIAFGDFYGKVSKGIRAQLRVLRGVL
jgi:hypothetical protein